MLCLIACELIKGCDFVQAVRVQETSGQYETKQETVEIAGIGPIQKYMTSVLSLISMVCDKPFVGPIILQVIMGRTGYQKQLHCYCQEGMAMRESSWRMLSSGGRRKSTLRRTGKYETCLFSLARFCYVS